jgi:hypothetical protein
VLETFAQAMVSNKGGNKNIAEYASPRWCLIWYCAGSVLKRTLTDPHSAQVPLPLYVRRSPSLSIVTRAAERYAVPSTATGSSELG